MKVKRNENNVVVEIQRDDSDGFEQVSFNEVRDGDKVRLPNGRIITVEDDAHPSGDATYDGWLFYDTNGESYFPEDFQPNENTTAGRPIVTEYCSNCGTEVELLWDVKKQGYKAFCPHCGARLMLCDECQHRDENGKHVDDCDYCRETDSCRFNPAFAEQEDSELEAEMTREEAQAATVAALDGMHLDEWAAIARLTINPAVSPRF